MRCSRIKDVIQFNFFFLIKISNETWICSCSSEAHTQHYRRDLISSHAYVIGQLFFVDNSLLLDKVQV